MKTVRIFCLCYISLFFCIPFLFSQVYTQELPIEDTKLYSIISKNDTINFIRVAKNTAQCKPTILFCQGSLPIPLIIIRDNKASLSAFNFDYKKLILKYNIIIISKPNTPIVADVSTLIDYCYVPDISSPNEFDQQYLDNNYLEKYIERGNDVIKFLQNQTWVDKEKIILLGHSEGASVATRLAEQNPFIHALGYFSGNPDGRFVQYIREERLRASKGVISAEEAQKNIEQKYEFWKDICRAENENGVLPKGGDPWFTWKSFSCPNRDILPQLKMPVFITYGTEDSGAIGCDLLPIYFELEGNYNYKIRAWINCGHNFEPIRSDGSSDYENMHWQEVVDEFIEWVESFDDI